MTQTYWHFGETSLGLYFDQATNIPAVTSNSYTPYTNEGCGVLNDPVTGQLRFYTDGLKVIDATHTVMPNGANLQGNVSCFGSGKIAVDPANCNRFYIFHNSTDMSFNDYGDLRYTLVDITLPGNGSVANPLGDVVPGQKNILIGDSNGEGMELVPQANSRNCWILLSDNLQSAIDVYFLSEAGLSFSGTYPLNANLTDIRSIRISPNLERGVVCSLRENEVTMIFDFDAVNGVLSNFNVMPGTPMGNNTGWYGIFDAEWSANSSKLYLSKYRTQTPASGGRLFQYDLDFPMTPPMLIHQVSDNASNLGRGLRRGPDQKIYWIYHNPVTSNTRYIGAVNSPDLPGNQSAFEPIGIDMGATLGLAHLFPTFLSFKNTIPSVDPITVDFTFPCEDTEPQLVLDLGEYLMDAEGDMIIITSVAIDNGTATFLNDVLTFSPSDQISGTSTINISYCDDYCFPLCESLTIVVNIEFDGISNFDFFSEDSITCYDSVLLSVNAVDLEILWSTGAETSDILVTESGVYSFTATSSTGCQLSDSISVFISNDQYDPITSLSLLQCDSPSAILEVNANGESVLWSTGQTTENIAVTESGTYAVTVGNIGYCPVTDSITVNLLDTPEIEIAFTDLNIICDDEPIQVSVNGFQDASILWSTSEITNTIALYEPGNYHVIVTNDCGSDEINFEVLSGTSPYFELPESIYQCFALDTIIGVPGFESYLWSDGSTQDELHITESGDYFLTVENLCGVHVDFITAFVKEGPNVNLESEWLNCIRDTIVLNVPFNEGLTYLWNSGDTTNFVHAVTPGIYSVNVSNECGVIGNSFEIAGDECLQTIFIPNSFTPNNDGINDYWFVEGNNVTVESIQIFNRWGDKIFESDDATLPWIGQVHNGVHFAPDGVYAYRVLYTNLENNLLEKKGHITLIR